MCNASKTRDSHNHSRKCTAAYHNRLRTCENPLINFECTRLSYGTQITIKFLIIFHIRIFVFVRVHTGQSIQEWTK